MYSTKAKRQITHNSMNISIFFFFLIQIKVIQQLQPDTLALETTSWQANFWKRSVQ